MGSRNKEGAERTFSFKIPISKVHIGTYLTREQIRAEIKRANPGVSEVHFARHHTWLYRPVPNSDLIDLSLVIGLVVPDKGWLRTERSLIALEKDIKESSWE